MLHTVRPVMRAEYACFSSFISLILLKGNKAYKQRFVAKQTGGESRLEVSNSLGGKDKLTVAK